MNQPTPALNGGQIDASDVDATSAVPVLTIPWLATMPTPGDGFDAAVWAHVPPTPITHVHPRSSAHRPRVLVRVATTVDALLLAWRVHDRYVVSRASADNEPVCLDSCVECFLAPMADRGHINIEINAGGVAHASHVTAVSPFACHMFSATALRQIGRRGTLPTRVNPEITDPCTWDMLVTIPYRVLSEAYGIPVRPIGTWRANLYKCADRSSHPHWLSWAPLGERLAFHQPDRFGIWRFAER